MNNILIFSPTPSHPQNAGNRKRIYNIARYLKNLGNEIHYIYFTQEGISTEQQTSMKEEWDTLTVIKKEKDYKLNGRGIYLADDWYQDNIGPIVKKKCEEYEINIVLVINLFQSKLFECLPSHILKLIDAQEKFTNRHIMLEKSGIKPDYYYTIESEEKKALSRADKILAIQDKEANFFKSILDIPVEVFNHIEIEQYLEKEYDSLRKIGFIGSANSINLKSLNEFINKFILFIDKYKLNITLEIAGSICNKLTVTHKFINMHGFVDSEKNFYESVDLIINPLITGTGLKIKSVEALSFALPIISTKIGFDGLESNMKVHALDNIDDLLTEIKKLYESPANLNLLSLESKKIFSSYEKKILSITKDIFLENRKRILIITHINFWELDLGSRYRLYFLLEYLNRHFDLTIAYTGKKVSSDEEKIVNLGYEKKVFFIDEFKEVNFEEESVINFISKHKFLKSFYNKSLYSKMFSFIKDKNFDAIIFEYIHLSYFKPLFTEEMTILDSHDIMSKRCEKFKQEGKKHWIELTEQEELILFKEYDFTLSIQKNEHAFLLNKEIKSLLVPHANLINSLTKSVCFKNLIFIGGNNEANLNAICWFIDYVWDSFKYTKLNLVIYGMVCSGIKEIYPKINNKKNIYLKGRTDNLNLVYEDASLIINPVRIGGGLKIKNVEALSKGLPLITTKEGAFGMEDGINSAFLVANNKKEWIEFIFSLMLSKELRIDLSNNAIEYAKSNFSEDVCYSELVNIIKDDN